MEFTCTQENLLQGLSQVAPVAGRNSQLPILQNILLHVKEGVLHLTGTDLEVGIHAIVGGKVGSEGSGVVPARALFDYVQQLPSSHPVQVKREKKGVLVATEGFRAVFPMADAEDFPLLPSAQTKKGLAFNTATVCQGLGRVLFAAARENTRPEIHSVFMKGEGNTLFMVATDSFRLAEYAASAPEGMEGFSLLLPLHTAQEIIRLFSNQKEIHLFPQNNTIMAQAEGVELSSRLVDGAYPDYKQIVPESWKTKVVLDRTEFLRALKTLLVFLPRDSRRVSLTAHPAKGQIQFRVAGGEVGEGNVQIACEGEGGDMEMLFNVQYLIEGAQHIEAEKCELHFQGSEAPLVVRPYGEDTYVYVVMPIQV